MKPKVSVVFRIEGSTIWVAGHRGMAGSAIVRRLKSEPCEVLTAAREVLDLSHAEAVADWLADARPDAIVLAAAKVGGILANCTYPADFLYDNLAIQNAVIHGAFRTGVKRLVFLGSSCIYPRAAAQPMREDALLTGPLEPTNEWYAIAKIAGIKLCQAYQRQHGCDYISAMPTNLVGPGDNYDPENSHVVAALIRKAHAGRLAGDASMVVWGTGTPLREFLYVDDLADAIVFLLQHDAEESLINVGTGTEHSIRELAQAVCRVVGFRGNLVFDPSKPDGMPRKLMDSSRLHAMGWRATTTLEDALSAAYDWYLANRAPTVPEAGFGIMGQD